MPAGSMKGGLREGQSPTAQVSAGPGGEQKINKLLKSINTYSFNSHHKEIYGLTI